jgi:KaiC/GvpD/RAD55 family RecA-like ATPase
MTAPQMDYIQFGIPALDELISANPSPGKRGVLISKGKGKGVDIAKICLIGPDGVGKSIFALHLAAYYAADCKKFYQANYPKIIYVSTGLRYENVASTIGNFNLTMPLSRAVPFCENKPDPSSDFKIEFRPCTLAAPTGPQVSLASYLSANDAEPPSIAYLDLSANSAGDGWGLLNRILALLSAPDETQPRHMIILDAVEGLQTLTGEQDAYGENRTRRSRIAQLARAAEGKCHLMTIVEDDTEEKRLPEDDVSNVVIRLRNMVVHDKRRTYVRRTVEIEKANGQNHVRGSHAFTIRDARGTTTGQQVNADDPICGHTEADLLRAKEWLKIRQTSSPDSTEVETYDDVKYLSYVHVLHSLDYYNRKVMGRVESSTPKEVQVCAVGFGIEHLDDMLYTDFDARLDSRGLPCSNLTTLIGETGTHKMRLATAFLGQCFRRRTPLAVPQVVSQVAILITNENIEREELCKNMEAQCASLKIVKDSVLCRRLEVHDIAASTLFHIINETIWTARNVLNSLNGTQIDRNSPTAERYKQGKYIRLVLYNFSSMATTYPDIRDDSILIPALTFFLKQEGINAMFVVTEEGSPTDPNVTETTRILKNQTNHHLHTWRVPFFNAESVAIMALPSVTEDRPSVIRELVLTPPNELRVNPHFEMYTGMIEKEPPRLSPLEVRLWGSSPRFQKYLKHSNQLFREVFPSSVLGESSDDVVKEVKREDYASLKALNNLQGDTRGDKTYVIQVDEFWAQQEGPLCPMTEYLYCATTTDANGTTGPNRINDPYEFFQPTLEEEKAFAQRHQFFTLPDNVLPDVRYGYQADPAKNGRPLDCVPYMWEFGMLLLRKSLWENAQAKRFQYNYGSEDNINTVGAILKTIQEKKHLTWRHFLHACCVVATFRMSEASELIYPFDVDMTATETFSCLILEIWMSEIYLSEGNNILADQGMDRGRSSRSLESLLDTYDLDLYRAWLMLGEAFTAPQFGSDGFDFERRPFHCNASSSRHWYATACPAQEEGIPDDFLSVSRLPGRYTTRGDWFLAIPRRSRAPRLGLRAIDLLSSRRANVIRLQQGIGLPVRRFIEDAHLPKVWTRLLHAGSSAKNMTYDELLELGASRQAGADPFHWLWRNTILNYDRNSRVFLKMNARMVYLWGKEFRAKITQDSRNGFEAYDKTRAPGYDKAQDPIFHQFREEMNVWISALKAAYPLP